MNKPTKNKNYSNKGPFRIYTYCFYTSRCASTALCLGLTRYRVDQYDENEGLHGFTSTQPLFSTFCPQPCKRTVCDDFGRGESGRVEGRRID